MDPIKITRQEYESKFGSTAPIPITRAEYNAKFGIAPEPSFASKALVSLGRGSADLLSMLAWGADIITGQALGRKLAERIAEAPVPLAGPMEEIQALKEEYLPKPEAEGIERYALGALESAPFAAIPGGGLAMRLTSALGAGLGGEVAKDLGAPEWAGELVGGVVPGAAYATGKAALGGIGRAIVPDTKKLVSEGVQNVLDAAGVDRAKVLKTIESGVPANIRIAEAARDPGLASITKNLEIKNPIAGARGAQLDDLRELQRQALILRSQGPVRSAEGAGKLFREELKEGIAKIDSQIKEAYAAARSGAGTIPLTKSKFAIAAFVDDIGKENISPQAREILNRFNKSKALPSVEEYIDLQQRINTALGDHAAIFRTGNASVDVRQGYRVLGKLSNLVDEAFEDAAKLKVTKTASGKIRGVSKKTADALRKAKELRAQKGQLFESYAIDDVLARDRFTPKLLPSEVPPRLLKTPEEARQAKQALSYGGSKEGQRELAAQYFEQLKSRAISPLTSEFSAAKFANEFRKNKEIAKEFLSPTQIKAIKQVRDDLVRRSSFDRMARRATAGTSPTAQFMGTAGYLKNAFVQKALGKLGPIGRALENLSAGRLKEIEKQIDETLLKVAFEPDAAKLFLGQGTREKAKSVLEKIVELGFLPGISQAMVNDSAPLPKETKSKIERVAKVAERLPDPIADVDLPRLFKAVVRQESGGNPKAVSKVGAQGLMQIMPATAKEIAGELGVTDYDIFDPETNKRFGEYYLKKQLKRFGDMRLALAAYNAGPARVARWIERYGPSWEDIAKGIQRVNPNHETLGYVRKIMGYYNV